MRVTSRGGIRLDYSIILEHCVPRLQQNTCLSSALQAAHKRHNHKAQLLHIDLTPVAVQHSTHEFTCDLLYPQAPAPTSGPALFAAWSHQPVNTLDGLGARHRRRTHFAVAALLLRDGLTVEGAAGNVVDIGLHFAVVWRNACGEHPRRGLVVLVEALCCYHLACDVQSARV